MADEIDLATDLIDHEVRQALKIIEMKRQASTNNLAHPSMNEFCLECGIDIPDARRELGYTLCLDCAKEREHQEKMFANKN